MMLTHITENIVMLTKKYEITNSQIMNIMIVKFEG